MLAEPPARAPDLFECPVIGVTPGRSPRRPEGLEYHARQMSNDRQIAFGSKLSFGVGQVAEGLKNTAFGMFVLFYYNNVLGVSGTLCGLAVGIALIFDAVTDPLAGSLSDNWKSRLGRRHPFMYASALPLGICFVGLFTPPALSEWGLFFWLITFSILTRGAMTLYHVPHIALGAELTENFVERTSIVAWRTAFGYVGGLLAAVIAFGYYFSDARGGRINADAYSPYSMVLAVLMVVTIWYSAWGTRREIPFLPQPTESGDRHVLRRMFRELGSAFQNHSFRWLFSGVLIVFLMVGVDGALNLYMYEYFWELTGPQILLLVVISPLPVRFSFGTSSIESIAREGARLPLSQGLPGSGRKSAAQ